MSLMRGKFLNLKYLFCATKAGFRGKINAKSFSEKPPDVNPKESVSHGMESLRQMVVPTDFHKRILVWTGRFKKMSDVPDRISAETLDKAKNKMRIKVSNYSIVATLIACMFMMASGRRAQQRGESLQKMNLDWHKEMSKKIDEERAAAAAALERKNMD
ncbi:UPF0389 protein CG9231 [Lycorma delicatula]|uniref:UPF0389 protein CG9231 n=1 Tax=Lycorma delicatula TaxID=130591 RepID=UPI003F515718